VHYVFEIETSAFMGMAPRPEAVNELIGGDEMCAWFRERLASRGVELSQVWPEDHGWDFEAKIAGRTYLLVCSCDFADTNTPATWHALQVWHSRSLADRIFGRNKSQSPDSFLELTRELILSNSDFALLAEHEV
jgi:hypothetical protein